VERGTYLSQLIDQAVHSGGGEPPVQE